MFFSVKTTVKIAGKVYTPCVCYALPEVLAPTISKMVNEGKAYIYDKKVYFQNGKVLEKESVIKETPVAGKPKKSKKEKTFEAEEEIPSPEEIADDDLGGF